MLRLEPIFIGKVATIPFHFMSDATIYKVSKTSNVVTLTTIETHGFSSGRAATVELNTPNANFDGGITISTTPTTRSLTYTLAGSDVPEAYLYGKVRSPYNLTGKTLKLTIKDNIDDDDDDAIYSGSLTLVTATDGTAYITLGTADTDGFTEGMKYFDVQDDTTDEVLLFGELPVLSPVRSANS